MHLFQFKDVTLIILLVSAIVSLALSFYRPHDDGLGGNVFSKVCRFHFYA